MYGFKGGSDINALVTGTQGSALKSAMAALRGTDPTHGATGFDGYKDLKHDYASISENIFNTGSPGVRGKGYDRPLLGIDTGSLHDPALPSTNNFLSDKPVQTYQATVKIMDSTGNMGTIFYKTHPNSGKPY